MIEVSQNRIEEAKKLVNKIDIIISSATDIFEEVKRLTCGRGVDVAITACSVGQAQEDALRISAKRGRISLIGGIPCNAKGFLDSN